MEDLNLPAAQVDDIAVLQQPGGRTLEDPVVFNMKVRRQVAVSEDHLPDLLRRAGEAALEPGELRPVGVKFREMPVAADVVPVDMGGCRRHRPVRQRLHRGADIADAQAGVNQKGFLLTLEEVTVGLLPVAVLADDVCILVDRVDGEPIGHC